METVQIPEENPQAIGLGMPGRADQAHVQPIGRIKSFIDYVTLPVTPTVRYFIAQQNPLVHEIQWSEMT